MIYPGFLVYELVRLFTLLQQGGVSGSYILPVTWYAAIPLVCLVPVLFFMLAMDEQAYTSWLPLITLIKGLGIPSLLFYIVDTFPEAISYCLSDNFAPLAALAVVALFVLGDIATGIYCFRRSRKVCK